MTQIRAFSFGGGVQSTAVLALHALGRIPEPFDHWFFANVGDDSEHPATLAYVHDHAVPFAAAHGIVITEVERRRRDGERETLLGRLTREGSRSLPIPVRMPDTGAPGTRQCTSVWKIKVVGRRLREMGATPENPAIVGLGISVDEIHRAKQGIDPKAPYQYRTYPLLDLGMSRDQCVAAIVTAGLPVPPKSACWFCPFHRPAEWSRMKREEPDLFDAAADLETLLNERRDILGKDHVYLTRFGRPLREAISPDGVQLAFEYEDEGCDSGFCFT